MSGADLIELEEARRRVLAAARPLGVERLALAEALGRALAEPAASREPVPGFDNSAMDGFAVRAADTRGASEDGPVALRLVGESRAGHPFAGELGPGQACRISTGAAIPAGADAVVRVEDTDAAAGPPRGDVADGNAGEVSGDGGGPGGAAVRIMVEVEPGKDIRRAGEDIAAGQTVLEPGAWLGPAELGVLASLGYGEVECRRRPSLRLIASGDELIEPGEPTRPGAVRNSNRFALAAQAERAGATVTGQATIGDDPEATRAAIEAALSADVVVVSGGISVGPHDHVKRALAELGVEEVFWRIALKPGKPTWFGVRGGTLVFGLPGNPVSAMVTFQLLVRPALDALSGVDPQPRRARALLGADFKKQPGRTHAARCRLELSEDGPLVWPMTDQGSHILTSMLGADCLALLPTEAGAFAAGDPVDIELL